MARTTVKVIEDSISNLGNRVTTLELEYPRYIHSELMTHRMFSRNAQSSRAIPVNRLIERVEEENWYPIFMLNKPGMEATNKPEEAIELEAKLKWDLSKLMAVEYAKDMVELDIHKQVVNRLLEPYSKIKVILTATDFDNFFKLRLAPSAQQEIQELAALMKEAINNSTPKQLDLGEWHLPYVRDEERIIPLKEQVKLCVARTARVSYLNHDGKRDIDRDFYLHDTLLKDMHMSPFEHACTPSSSVNQYFGNFKGWIQYRKHIETGWKIK